MACWLVGCLCLAPGALARANVVSANYAEPTTRYAHGVLGDAVEWGSLVLQVAECASCEPADVVVRLPVSRVFEDLHPRVVAINDRGDTAAMVVESHQNSGARLALYNADGLLAATPYIGTPNRWLAPIGAADLDGDGSIEFAYIDRPHLAKTVRVWRLVAGSLVEVASRRGFSNHRIGWDYIVGGVRDCGEGVEMVVASGDWRHVIALRLTDKLEQRVLVPYSGEAVAAALGCG